MTTFHSVLCALRFLHFVGKMASLNSLVSMEKLMKRNIRTKIGNVKWLTTTKRDLSLTEEMKSSLELVFFFKKVFI